MTAELVGPLPTITFFGAGDRVRHGYAVPRDTSNLRARLCTDHHPACDCREALLNEQLREHRSEWIDLHTAARTALSGHQVTWPDGLQRWERRRFPVCLCSGCVIHRATHNVLAYRDIDYKTGKVR